jgi:hypothetical protein
MTSLSSALIAAMSTVATCMFEHRVDVEVLSLMYPLLATRYSEYGSTARDIHVKRRWRDTVAIYMSLFVCPRAGFMLGWLCLMYPHLATRYSDYGSTARDIHIRRRIWRRVCSTLLCDTVKNRVDIEKAFFYVFAVGYEGRRVRRYCTRHSGRAHQREKTPLSLLSPSFPLL